MARDSQRGFSLVEVLVSLVVLAVGLVSLAKFQATLLRDGNLARERSEAVAMAQDQMEALRNFTNPGQFNRMANRQATRGPAEQPGLGNTFTVQAAVQPAPNARAVDVTVHWNDSKGKPQQVMLSSQIANLPPSNSMQLLGAGDPRVTMPLTNLGNPGSCVNP